MLMGFLPWMLNSFHAITAPISWLEWPGFVKGAEISVLDTLSVAVYFGSSHTRQPLPFRISMLPYFVAASFSVLLAPAPLAAFFYPWQLVRMYVVYAAVTRACAADPRAAAGLLKGMAAGLLLEAGFAVWDRFVLGELEVAGTLTHKNGLGMMSHFVVFPYFALLLTKQRGWLPAATVLAGVVVEALSVSRAAAGLAGVAYAVIFLFSAVRQWTSRKLLIMLCGVLVVAAVTPVILISLEKRYAVEDFGDYDERAAFERAAAMMLSDHPLGVGANHFGTIAIVEGYYARAGVAPTRGSMSAQVHNVYWLIAAETGYLGLLTFILLLLRPVTVAFGCGWRHRADNRGDLLLGLGVALLVVYIHSLFEWVFILSQIQYMFALDTGLIAGVAIQLGYWRQPADLQGHHHRQRASLGVETSQSGPTRNVRRLQ